MSSDKSGPSGGNSGPVGCADAADSGAIKDVAVPNGGSVATAANDCGLVCPAVAPASCCPGLSCAEDCSVCVERVPAPCAEDCTVCVERVPAPLLHDPLEDTAMPALVDWPGHGMDDELEPTS
mmetsp:Transcript_69909/g.138400  ORF Transcript_69909/g.138400 Transcript_69909/m.138400 type:complete len:123 (+) Transcript_69909:401-769(+)